MSKVTWFNIVISMANIVASFWLGLDSSTIVAWFGALGAWGVVLIYEILRNDDRETIRLLAAQLLMYQHRDLLDTTEDKSLKHLQD